LHPDAVQGHYYAFGQLSTDVSFSYSPSTPMEEITLPGGVIIPGGQ
jgi:hypothetical protein